MTQINSSPNVHPTLNLNQDIINVMFNGNLINQVIENEDKESSEIMESSSSSQGTITESGRISRMPEYEEC